MKTNSLSFRLFISSAFILTAFFYLVTFVLEQSFRESVEKAVKEKLQIHIYSLLSVAELTDNGELKMPKTLREPRFSNPGSGLYAVIKQVDNVMKWRSISAVGIELPSSTRIKPGEAVFAKSDTGRFLLDYAVIWENEEGLEQYYLFTVAEDGLFAKAQVAQFRDTLRVWLLFIGFFLVFILFWVLRWSLRPLRVIGEDLEQIEQGTKSRLDGRYPSELKGLAGNLNILITSERAHLERYRNTLADLAHSLKTPLAILTGCIEPDVVNKKTIAEQISRMNEIVEYQLQKAAAKGQKQLMGEVELSVLLEKIISSLKKVYRDKQIIFSFDQNDNCMTYCEEGDIYEIVGNLLDNAAKWCKTNVAVSLIRLDGEIDSQFSVLIQIEDDGPGIPKEKLDAILQRGVRADEHKEGHGIGMAVVSELTELLDGKLVAGKNQVLGGMKWQVYLP